MIKNLPNQLNNKYAKISGYLSDRFIYRKFKILYMFFLNITQAIIQQLCQLSTIR
jgi:hypothetical protein